MRAHSSVAPVVVVASFICSFVSQAQSVLPLPGCEASPEVRRITEEKLEWNLLDKMKFAERLAYQLKVLEDLMARYPRELKPFVSYASWMSEYAPEEYASVRDRWVQSAKDHPDDPLALVIAGKALVGNNTPQAISLLDAARAKAPDFPWPSLYLASIYGSGKRADPAKTKQNLETFLATCPSSTDDTVQWLLNKDVPAQSKVATALRARLATETDPKRLQAYSILWGLEFRTHPPSEHDAIRAQVALDLKRLEILNPHGSAEWENFLHTGYKQSGASKETVTAMEDRLLHDFPHSTDASDITYERWDKAHPKPEDQTDTAAWTKYQKEYEEAVKGWVREFTDSSYFQHDAWFYAIREDEAVTERDGIAAMDAYLQAARDHESPRDYSNYEEGAAEFLVEKKWQLARALALLEDAKAIAARNRASEETNDNLSDEDAKDQASYRLREDQDLDGLILRAAMEAGLSEPALKLKAELEGPVPSEKKRQSAYWLNRARLATIEKHPQDALTYYQMALQTRLSAPKMYRGKLHDDLTDEARSLFKEQGGSETAWAVWSKPPGGAQQAAEGRWEKATKQIPEFELSDMNGRTWKLKELGGKTLLINLWATWCGPCQAELPHLEKLYEKTKDRKDIQVLTFDLDEDLGVVAPYLKEKGYTFPVLPAYSTVVSLLDGFAIPQTWIVDPQGVWQSKQIGFSGGSDADFEKEMLQRLDSAKAGQ
ncbi:MAG TPA: redoxin domain-containing protein [Terracidiphilus sp.]|nr:redoxin domain-containing protein [Terracidiphilus sp.]